MKSLNLVPFGARTLPVGGARHGGVTPAGQALPVEVSEVEGGPCEGVSEGLLEGSVVWSR